MPRLPRSVSAEVRSIQPFRGQLPAVCVEPIIRQGKDMEIREHRISGWDWIGIAILVALLSWVLVNAFSGGWARVPHELCRTDTHVCYPPRFRPHNP